jgi:hypothetical protein
MITGAVRDLYVARWGEPSRKATFREVGLEAEIYKWNAETTAEGVTLYATIGASAYPMAGLEQGHRTEYFLGLLPPRDHVASPLAGLALYSNREGTAVGHGDTIPADGPLWPGTEMRRFLVLRPVDEVIPPLELSGGVHVDFMQAIPIFDSELSLQGAARREVAS